MGKRQTSPDFYTSLHFTALLYIHVHKSLCKVFILFNWIGVLLFFHFKGSVMGERSGQLCIITRCNYTLFNEAVNVCCANNNTKVGFVGVSHD